MATRKSIEFFKENIAPRYTGEAAEMLKDHMNNVKKIKDGYYFELE